MFAHLMDSITYRNVARKHAPTLGLEFFFGKKLTEEEKLAQHYERVRSELKETEERIAQFEKVPYAHLHKGLAQFEELVASVKGKKLNLEKFGSEIVNLEYSGKKPVGTVLYRIADAAEKNVPYVFAWCHQQVDESFQKGKLARVKFEHFGFDDNHDYGWPYPIMDYVDWSDERIEVGLNKSLKDLGYPPNLIEHLQKTYVVNAHKVPVEHKVFVTKFKDWFAKHKAETERLITAGEKVTNFDNWWIHNLIEQVEDTFGNSIGGAYWCSLSAAKVMAKMYE